MSLSHNRRAMIKLTPKNELAVDGIAAKKTKAYRIKVSRAAVANEAIEIGIKHIKP